MLKGNSLSREILDYLKYKIEKSILSTKFDFFRKTFQRMLDCGMTYFTSKCYRNVIKCEMNVFANMLEILHLWKDCCLEFDDTICDYLKHNSRCGLNLGKVKFNFNKSENVRNSFYSDENLNRMYLDGANLGGAVLEGINLSGSSLIGANLRFARFTGSNLSFADLQKANLLGADLKSTDMSGIDLRKTVLNGADIRFAQLNEAYFREADINLTKFDQMQIEYIETQCKLQGTRTRVYVYEIDKIISYEEYCDKKKEYHFDLNEVTKEFMLPIEKFLLYMN